ncbi:MAG: cell division protein ZapA [Alistipes sp.]|nr:cell division protein ZapA [Candidatus Alistipes equi]
MQKTYPMMVTHQQEELYMRAQNEVNKLMKNLMSKHLDGYSTYDYFATAIILLAAENIKLRTSGELENDEIKKIQDLSSKIEKSFL